MTATSTASSSTASTGTASTGAGEEPVSPSTVQGTARRAFGWSLLNSVAGRFATVAVGLVLARLLVPEEYGTFAVAILVLAVLQSMNELGVSVAVIQWPGDVRRAAHTATTLALGASALLYAGVYAVAPSIAGAIGAPGSTAVIRVLALGVLIDGISSIPAALMTRAFEQQRRAVADLVALVPSSIVSIVLATQGHGAMSLAYGSLAGNLTATALILILAPARPLPGWHRDDAVALLRVGLPLAGTSLVLLATMNLDYVVVGRQLGTTALGLYLLAFNLSSWPSNLLSIAVRRVAIPGFARLAGERAELERAFTGSLRALSMAGFLLAAPLAALASAVLGVVYGPRWMPAGSALAALAILGGLRIVFDLAYDLLAGVGHSRVLLWVQVAWFVGLLIALPIGASIGGIGGVAIAHVIVAFVVVGPLYLVALGHAGLAVRRVLAALAPVAVATVMCIAVCRAGSELGLEGSSAVAAIGAVGVVAYALSLAACPSTRTMMHELWRRIRFRFGRAAVSEILVPAGNERSA
jgi:O-antigen/teichoic acid export membrane protein